MTERERFHQTMRFGSPDRVPYWEMGGWPQTIDRWQDEGMPADVHFDDHFGLDRHDAVPLNTGLVPPFRPETLEETDRHIISRRSDGVVTMALKEGTVRGTRMSMDKYIEFPVRDRTSWNEFKKRLNPKSPLRYLRSGAWEDYKKMVKDRDYPLAVFGGSFFGWPRDWMGFEGASMMVYDDPALMHEITEYIGDFVIEIITPALQEIGDIDYGVFWEDMCYKTASIISPRHFREFCVPQYKRVTHVMRKYGVKTFLVDSDGYVDELIPLWLEGGVNGIYPLEVMAGEDPVGLRKRYGKDLVMWGGIDKVELTKDKAAVEREVRAKVPFLIGQGGWIPGIDHAVPPDVPYENFLYYRKLVCDIAERGA